METWRCLVHRWCTLLQRQQPWPTDVFWPLLLRADRADFEPRCRDTSCTPLGRLSVAFLKRRAGKARVSWNCLQTRKSAEQWE